MEFKQSETMRNLMRAFAGESLARNRYTMAAAQAKQNNLYVINFLFTYTADQEKEHAEIFYKHLQEMAGENIQIEGTYPVDIDPKLSQLLKMAQHNEYEEHDDVYKKFAEQAKAEGFENVANSFHMIGDIEKTHGDRFGKFAECLEKNELFVSNVETKWICLNCGHIIEAKGAPQKCPVCSHDQGYFIRMELSPFY